MTASEPRCELTDLLVSQCSHCRRGRPQPPRRTPEPPPLAEGERRLDWSMEVPNTGGVVAVFEAEYHGECADCSDHIYPGDTIGRTEGAEYVCSSCIDDRRK